MKKKLLIPVLALGLLLATGCTAETKKNLEKKGGFISSPADHIVIKHSGGEIMDIWKLTNQFVSSETDSDGISFINNEGNPVIVQGDVNVIRINKDRSVWDQYEEYHKTAPDKE